MREITKYYFKGMIVLWLSLSVLSSSYATYSNNDSVKTEKRLSKWFFIPIVTYSPEQNWTFGGGGVHLFRFHKGTDTLTRTSNIQGSFLYTLNHQILSEPNYFIITNKDKYIIKGMVGYNKFPMYFYGTGNHTGKEKELISYSIVKFENITLRRLLHYVYAGIGFRYFNIYDIKYPQAGLLSSRESSSAKGSVTSGLSVAVNFDNRNNVLTTTKGWYASITNTFHGHAFGGNVNFNKLIIDVRKFIGPLPRNKETLALQGYFQCNSGNVPFNELGLMGGNMIMRGYYLGRFRDNILAAMQAEYRVSLFERFGMVAFLSTGEVANKVSKLRFQELKLAYGVGARIKIDKKENLNFRIDYGIGNGSGLWYVTIAESF